jgi:hypothetical protein
MRSLLRRPRRLPLTLLLFVLIAAEVGRTTPPTDSVRFVVNMDTAMAQLWANMPQDSGSGNVNLIGQTGPDCANEALRKARFALTEVAAQDAATRAAIQTVDIGKDVLEHALGVRYAGLIGDAIGLYLESNSVDELADNLKRLAAEKAGQAVASGVGAAGGAAGEHGGRTGGAGHVVEHAMEGYPAEKGAGELAKALWDQLNPRGDRTLFEGTFNDPACGPIAVTFELRNAPNGHKSIYFRASGNCQCKWPTNVGRSMQMGAFTVIGHGDLVAQNPVVSGSTITINYQLANTSYDVLASCGCAGGDERTVTEGGGGTEPRTPPPPPPPVYERICWQRCGHLWELWQEVQREADHFAESVRQQEAALAQPRRDLAGAEQALQAAQNRLRAANTALGRYNTASLQQNFPTQYHDAQTAVRSAQEDVGKWQRRAELLRQDIASRERTLANTRQIADRYAAEAAQKRDAYYRCAASCYDQARAAGEIKDDQQVPQDIREWQSAQPQTQTQQTSSTELGGESMLVGVVVAKDTRTNEKTTARVVTNPKALENVPGLRVIEVTTRVGLGKDGKPDTDTLQARIGDGPIQGCDKPFTGTIPGDGRPVPVSVGLPGQPPATGEIPITPGQPRTPPVSVRPEQFHAPAVLQRGTVGVVHGPFDGRSFGTGVTMGGKKAEILAESGGALYFIVPGNLEPGDNSLMVEEQGVHMRFRVATVGLQMAAGKLQLEKGESASFSATVTGADKVPASAWQAGDPSEFSDVYDMEQVRRMAPNFRAPGKGSPGVVLLLLQNMSPQVVGMSGGNTQQQELDSSAFRSGPYTHNGMVTAHQKGSFQIKGTVVPFLAPVAGEAAP